jgi:plasmid stabilization system protein ParE
MSYRVFTVPAAERDIHRAVKWWADHRSGEQAERWYTRIYPAIGTLSETPDRCPVASESDLLPGGLRQLHFGVGSRATHRIIFTIVGQEVRVLRVRHVAQQSLSLEDLH